MGSSTVSGEPYCKDGGWTADGSMVEGARGGALLFSPFLIADLSCWLHVAPQSWLQKYHRATGAGANGWASFCRFRFFGTF